MTLVRHPWLARFVPELEALVSAADLDPHTPDEAVVWRVPAFTWAPGTSEQGRKGAGRLMPFRVHWNVLSDTPGTRTGRAVGPGVLLDSTAEPSPVAASQLRHEAASARWVLFDELSTWAPKAVAAAHGLRTSEAAPRARGGALGGCGAAAAVSADPPPPHRPRRRPSLMPTPARTRTAIPWGALRPRIRNPRCTPGPETR